MLCIGSNVKVKRDFIIKIAKNNFELVKFLANKIGVVIEFDDITWHWVVKFDDRKYSFRWYHLEEIDEEN